MKKIVLFLCMVLGLLIVANAAYLRNVPQTLVQPNGDTLRCFATGDEYYHWLHDDNDFTIVLNVETGYFVYADRVGEDLVPTSFIPGRVDPATVGLTPGINISAEKKMAKRQAWEQAVPQRNTNSRMSNTGQLNNIVIFVRFSDDGAFTNSFTTVDNMFNDDAQGAVSMHNYFQSASYGQLDIESYFYPSPSGNSILSYQDTHPRSYFQPYSASNTNGYSDDSERESREFSLLKRAVEGVESLIPTSIDFDNDNDGYVDNVCFVVKGNVGGWSDLLWPHRWSLYGENATINGMRVWDFNFQLADATSYFNTSTLCHEMNHSLGAPDLYHYYDGTDLTPVGGWDLMEQNANPPQHMGAYMKFKYGQWIDEIPEIIACGSYSLYPLGTSSTHNCYKIASSNPDEFFVLEYRNKNNSFETALPGSGLLIYRINTNFEGNASYNGTSIFDEVYLFRPNGTQTNNGNIGLANFSANSGRNEFNENSNPSPFLTDGTPSDLYIHSISTAGGDSITFSYCPYNYISVTPTSLTLSSQDQASETFIIASDMNWTITGNPVWLNVSASSGNANAVITVMANSANNTFSDRTCTLTITAQNGVVKQVDITQSGITPYLTVQQISASLPSSLTDSAYVTMSCNHNWTVTADCDWLQTNPSTGFGSTEFAIYATALNPTCTPRTCLLTFTGETGIRDYVTVTQLGTPPQLSASPISYQFENETNDQMTLDIISNTEWNIISDISWLTLSDVSGSGNGSVTMTTCEYNNSSEIRYDTLIIETECNYTSEVIVSQIGIFLYTSESALMLEAPAQSAASMTIFANRNWQINNIPSWLIVSPSHGTGETEVVFTSNTANDDLIERAAIISVVSNDLREDILIYQNSIHTGIQEVMENTLSIYPIPADDILSVVLPSNDVYQYQFMDVTGKFVMSGQLSEPISHIRLDGLTSGVYFIRLMNSFGEISVHKVVKK